MRSSCALFLVLAGTTSLVASSPAPAEAQGLGSAAILGEVRNEAGERVALAQVEARYEPTGTLVQTTTNQAGRYQLVNLRPGGPYTVRVQTVGFRAQFHEEVFLRADQRLVLDFTLTEQPIELPGIEVRSIPDIRFDVTRNAPALTVTRQSIAAFPTIERNFMELADLSSMAVQTREEGGFSITGQPERHNAILIDGALNQDVFGTSSSGMPGARARAKPIPMDAIHEFRLEVAPFDARVTGFTGGMLNAITRSGTNEWEGSVFSQYRNERFFGDLLLDGENVAPLTYNRRIGGFNLGGPLSRDRAHFFVAGEFENRAEPAPGFTLGENAPIRTSVSPDSVARMAQILGNDYALDPGTPAQVSLENPLSNLFSRLDWRLSDAHTLTVTYNQAHAARDSTPNRASFGAYEFSSSAYRIESSSRFLSARLVSRLSGGHSNELMVNVQRIDEQPEPASRFPQIDVRVRSNFDGAPFVRDVRAGSRYFSQRDRLRQTVLQLTDAVTIARDEIVTTFGINADLFRFEHEFLPGGLGYYRFDSLADLEANDPSHYEIHTLLPGTDDPTLRFSVFQPGAFVQNEHRFPGGLVLRYGLRIEMPFYRKEPRYAREVEEEFDIVLPHFTDRQTTWASGIRTDGLPTRRLIFSPRIGFNYQSELRFRTQVRGGFGLFTGRVPFSWLSSLYRHNGLRSALLSCSGPNAPALDPALPAPVQCASGAGVEEAGERAVVGFHPDYSYPRELKVAWSVDQEVPGGFLLAIEGIFVQTFGRTVLRELNLGRPGELGEGYQQAFGTRIPFGEAVPDGFEPIRRADGFSSVLAMENDERSAIAYALAFDVEKRIADWFHLRGSYSMARSDDNQSLLFGDQVMNFAASPIGLHPNQVGPSPSQFDRPWKFVVNTSFRVPRRWGGSELSVLYVGQPGIPYSYVYGTDINGDGYPGAGIPLDASNDLIFVPDPPTSIPGSLTARSLFGRLVGMEPCLAQARARGGIMRRNTCRGPATHRVDLRLIQPVHFGGLRLEVSGDVLNVLNLLNNDWGRVWEVDPVVPVLDMVGRWDPEPGSGHSLGRPQLGYTGSLVRDPETGQLEPRLPYTLITPASQWQAQIGVRVSF